MSHRLRSFLRFLSAALFFAMIYLPQVQASGIKILPSPQIRANWQESEIKLAVEQVVNVADYREVRVQIFPNYLVLQLLQVGLHRADFLRLNLDEHHQVVSVQSSYIYSEEDLQTLDQNKKYSCPDKNTQFIAFAPNDDVLEQTVTLDVIKAAKARGFKVVSLLKEEATRMNYLSYMSCPNVIGNFYDGDSNPSSFITADGIINASELKKMTGLFRFRVTNIWVACEAFNDPLRWTLLYDTWSQKYAAGVNDLLVGPSDLTAACAMKAAIAGKPMKSSFDQCYHQLDSANDHWGFGGFGSDYFGY